MTGGFGFPLEPHRLKEHPQDVPEDIDYYPWSGPA